MTRPSYTKFNYSKPRMLTLLGELCNDTLTDANTNQIAHWLETEPQARIIYANYMAMHAELYSEPALLSTPTSLVNLDQPAGARVKKSPFRGWHLRGWHLALAASLAAVALTVGAWLVRDGSNLSSGPAMADANDASPGLPVAQITGTHNCLWKDNRQSVGYGEQLAAGRRLELAEGLAEITFNDGATILLEGPASFVVSGPATAELDAGRLAAVVPSRASSFRVSTQTLDLLDAGTEFGLHALDSGASEVHVFNGIVRADVLDARGRPRERLQLNATEAVRINPVSTTVMEFPADDGKFIRSLASSTGPHDGLLAYEGFTYPAGPLTAQNGGFGWAGPWFSIAADKVKGRDTNSVAKGSLAVEGIVPLGNRAALTGHENRIRRSLATSVGGGFDAAGLVENQDGVRLIGRDGKQVFLSFVQRVSKTEDEFYGLELHRGDGNANRVLCLGHGDEGAGYCATSNFNIYRAENAVPLGTEDTTAHLFVVKISYGTDNRDTLEVFRDPRPLHEESRLQPVAKLRGNFAFDRVSLANFHGEKIHEVDELRVGTNYAAVTKRWGGNRGRLIRRVANRQFTYPSLKETKHGLSLVVASHGWN
ncbi:FecR domain-containing protein [Adhaeretor mobilis]|uniref:FecR protein n=1 Tax=Adhaeretor mobilis TaxID=1930276 RepID=A0A517N0Y1_9BACT|nr:FecR domain-containing protein [Adhaeretor mobilis]QDT00799.1 FecR protein [Adhaeretor mobilis]